MQADGDVLKGDGMKKACFFIATLATVFAPLLALLMLGVTFAEIGKFLGKAGQRLEDLANGLMCRWDKLWRWK